MSKAKSKYRWITTEAITCEMDLKFVASALERLDGLQNTERSDLVVDA